MKRHVMLKRWRLQHIDSELSYEALEVKPPLGFCASWCGGCYSDRDQVVLVPFDPWSQIARIGDWLICNRSSIYEVVKKSEIGKTYRILPAETVNM